MISLRETCQQYVARRLSEGWRVAGRYKHLVFLSSPDGNILRPVDLRNDVETLRPNATGDEENIPGAVGGSIHWQLVDDVVHDGDTTHVYTNLQDFWFRDLYNISSPTGSGTINSIKVFARCRAETNWGKVKLVIKPSSTAYESPEKSIEYDTYDYPRYHVWTVNPDTSSAFTWEELENLQIGISLSLYLYATFCRCTQVWVEVDYTPPVAPTVTTQAVTDIGKTTATGNGTITDTGGENCTKRGVCWNTTGNPTVADDKSEETDSFGTGAFTRPMTGLTPGQHYYVKAYAYNSEGYGYGSQVEFTTFQTYAKTVSMDALLKAIDTEAVSLDTLLQAKGETKTVDLDTLLVMRGGKTISLDTLLFGTPKKTVALDVLLKALGITKTVELDTILVTIGAQTVDLDLILKGPSFKTVAIDVILSTYPGKAAKYILEIHQASTGDLIAILNNAHEISFSEAVKEAPTLSFALPADDAKAVNITKANEIWLRNYETGEIVKKFRLNLRRDARL